MKTHRVDTKMKFNFHFLKDRYDYELKRKDQITAALTLPVGILIALGAAMTAMARSFSYTDGYQKWLFLLSLSLAAVAFLLCVVFLGLAYHRQTYWYLPLLSELQTTRELFKELYRRESYNQTGSRDGDSSQEEQATDDFFQHTLEPRLIDAADKNTKTNDVRSDICLYWARVMIFAVLVFTAFAVIPYVVDQVRY